MPGPELERIELPSEEQAALEARGAAPDRTSCRGQSRSLTGNEVVPHKRVVSRVERAEGSAAPTCSNRTGRDQPSYDPVRTAHLCSDLHRPLCLQMVRRGSRSDLASWYRRARGDVCVAPSSSV
jgi:hypothetical protein